MSTRIFSCKSEHKNKHHCCPKPPPLRDEIVGDNAALQSNAPAGTATIASTTGIPATASPISTGAPIAFNISTSLPSSINSKIVGVAGTITGTFIGQRVLTAPFGFKVNAGVSILASTTSVPATTDFTATLVFVPDNGSAVLPLLSVSPSISTLVLPAATRYDFLFTNVGNADPSSSILTPGQFQIRLVSSLTVVYTGSTVTTISPSTFDLFVQTRMTIK